MATDELLYPGKTARFWLRDLQDPTTPAFDVSGAVVTFAIVDARNTIVATGTGTASGDDWYWIANCPSPAGAYHIQASAVVGGSVTWLGKKPLSVSPFVAIP